MPQWTFFCAQHGEIRISNFIAQIVISCLIQHLLLQKEARYKEELNFSEFACASGVKQRPFSKQPAVSHNN